MRRRSEGSDVAEVDLDLATDAVKKSPQDKI